MVLRLLLQTMVAILQVHSQHVDVLLFQHSYAPKSLSAYLSCLGFELMLREAQTLSILYAP